MAKGNDCSSFGQDGIANASIQPFRSQNVELYVWIVGPAARDLKIGEAKPRRTSHVVKFPRQIVGHSSHGKGLTVYHKKGSMTITGISVARQLLTG